jgi:AraC-like DNA-binding protein
VKPRAPPTHETGEKLTLPIPYVQHIAELIRSMGHDPERWLALGGLTNADLSPDRELDYAQFELLARNAVVITGEPALGLFIGARLGAVSHGILGFAAVNSATIREGLELVERYSRIRTSLVSISLVRAPHGLRVRFDEARPLGDIQRTVLEAVMLSIGNVLRADSTGICHIDEVAFAFPDPGYAALARDMFGCAVTYGATWSGFTVAGESLDVPLRTSDREALREATLICQRELEHLTNDESTSSRVRRLLLGAHDSFPSLQVTARLLHVTPRTLHRRLLDDGTSFRALLEEVRHALAVEHVRSGRLSMQEIAFRLGYSDVANFRRAFKRWEEAPPSAFKPPTAAPAPTARRRAERRGR